MTTDEIGKRLKKEYSLPTDQNKHIGHFFFRLSDSENISSIADEFLPHLQKGVGDESCALVDKQWPGFIIISCRQGASEEEREMAIDKQLRFPIARQRTDTRVMFSRACLYHSYEMNEDSIQASEIGEVVKQSNAQQKNAGNIHQDFFYLMTKHPQNMILDVISCLKTLSGSWKKVEPHDTWPDTFLGYFPKSPFDKTEREREARLNREVRLPLMKMLEDELMTTYPKTGDMVERRVFVLMTRACKLESANTGI